MIIILIVLIVIAIVLFVLLIYTLTRFIKESDDDFEYNHRHSEEVRRMNKPR